MSRFVFAFVFISFILLRAAFAEETVGPANDQQQILTWAEEAVSQTLTFSFTDHEERMASAKKKYFSQEGWESFKAINEGIWLEKDVIKYQQTIATFTPSSPDFQRIYARWNQVPPKANILNMSELGPQQIRIIMPVVITFRAGNKKSLWKRCYDITLQRGKLENNYDLNIIDWHHKEPRQKALHSGLDSLMSGLCDAQTRYPSPSPTGGEGIQF